MGKIGTKTDPEFTFTDEYFSDWELFSYSESTEVNGLSRSYEVNNISLSRSPKDMPCHPAGDLITKEDSEYKSSRMSSPDISSSQKFQWTEDCSNVRGIEYHDTTEQPTYTSPLSSLSFDSFLDNIYDSSEVDADKHCVKHKTSAMVHCDTCSELLCISCQFYHDNHKFKISKRSFETISSSKERHQRDLKEKKHHLADVRQYQKDVNQKCHLVKEHLNQQRATLIASIDSQFEKLNSQVELVWSQEILTTNRRIKMLRTSLEVERRHLEDIEKLLTDFRDGLVPSEESKEEVLCRKENALHNGQHTFQPKNLHTEFDLDLISRSSVDLDHFSRSSTDIISKSSADIDLFPRSLADLDLFSRSSPHRQYFILSGGCDSSANLLGQFSTGFINNNSNSNYLETCLVSRGTVKSSFRTRWCQGMSHTTSGLSLTSEGDLLVTDLGRDTVAIYEKDGCRKSSLNVLPQDEPTAAVQLDDGSFLAACKDGLKLLDGTGVFRRRVEPWIESPRGIALTASGTILVTDCDATGSLLHILSTIDFRCIHTIIGGSRAPLFSKAWYVATDAGTNIVISDSSDHTVKVLSSHGMLMYEFGGRGCKPGQLCYPAGVCVDPYGHILVADMGNNRIQMFSKSGEFLAVILTNEDGLDAPIDLQVDPDLDLIILQGNGVVKVVQYIY